MYRDFNGPEAGRSQGIKNAQDCCMKCRAKENCQTWVWYSGDNADNPLVCKMMAKAEPPVEAHEIITPFDTADSSVFYGSRYGHKLQNAGLTRKSE